MEVRGVPAAAAPAASASYSAGEEMFSTKTKTATTSRSSKMINYSGSLPTPSKFHKGDICHSDYESDWDASPIPPKWRPSHSDTEDLGFGSMKYRPVKPQLKSGNKSGSGKPRPQPSPPCPHQWESHDDIARLEISLREGRRRPASYSRPASTQPLLPAASRCQSTPPVNNVHQTRAGGGGATKSSTATRTTQEVQRSSPSRPASTQPHLPIRCQSTPPVNLLDTTRSSSRTSYNTSTTTTTKSEKREFISVKKRARLLEDIMTTPSTPLAVTSSSPKTSDEIPQELSAPPTERSTPIKPEDIPGAVRVFPMPMMSAASGSHWKHRDGRSASVDMNGYGGGSLAAGSAAARYSPITLPRATKNFRSQTSHHTSHETATTTTKLTTTSNDELMLPLLPTSSSRKFQVAINSTTSHQEDLRLQEEKEKKTTLKQSCNITDDSPPTIELIAYKCSDAGDVAGEGSGGSGGRGSYDETGEGYQISGYEADDDTLNSREMKLFKPSKFVPKLASSASVWKPSTKTTTTIGDAKLS